MNHYELIHLGKYEINIFHYNPKSSAIYLGMIPLFFFQMIPGLGSDPYNSNLWECDHQDEIQIALGIASRNIAEHRVTGIG